MYRRQPRQRSRFIAYLATEDDIAQDTREICEIINNPDLFCVDNVLEFTFAHGKENFTNLSSIMRVIPQKIGGFFCKNNILQYTKTSFVSFHQQTCLVGGREEDLLRVFFVRVPATNDETAANAAQPWEATIVSDVQKILHEAGFASCAETARVHHSTAITIQILQAWSEGAFMKYRLCDWVGEVDGDYNVQKWVLQHLGLCMMIAAAQSCPCVIPGADPDLVVYLSASGDDVSSNERLLNEIALEMMTRWSAANRGIKYKHGVCFDKNGRKPAYRVEFIHGKDTPAWTVDQMHLVLKRIGYKNLLDKVFLVPESEFAFGKTRFDISELEEKNLLTDRELSTIAEMAKKDLDKESVSKAMDAALAGLFEEAKQNGFVLLRHGTVLLFPDAGKEKQDEEKQDVHRDAICCAYEDGHRRTVVYRKRKTDEYYQALCDKLRQAVVDIDNRFPDYAKQIKTALLAKCRRMRFKDCHRIHVCRAADQQVNVLIQTTDSVQIVVFHTSNTDMEDGEALCTEALERYTRDIILPLPIAFFADGGVVNMTASMENSHVDLLQNEKDSRGEE